MGRDYLYFCFAKPLRQAFPRENSRLKLSILLRQLPNIRCFKGNCMRISISQRASHEQVFCGQDSVENTGKVMQVPSRKDPSMLAASPGQGEVADEVPFHYGTLSHREVLNRRSLKNLGNAYLTLRFMYMNRALFWL